MTTRVDAEISQVRGHDCYHFNSKISKNTKSLTETITASRESTQEYINGRMFVADPSPRNFKSFCCMTACANLAYSVIACPTFLIEYGTCVPCLAVQIFCPCDCNPHDGCVGPLLSGCERPNQEGIQQPYITFADCLGDYGAEAVSRWVGKCFDFCSPRAKTYYGNEDIDTILELKDLTSLNLDLESNESMKNFMDQKSQKVVRYKGSAFLPFIFSSLNATAVLFDPKDNKSDIQMVFICNKEGKRCKDDKELVKTTKAYIDLVHKKNVVAQQPNSQLNLTTPLLAAPE